jgi:hypothetical protein
MIYCRYQLLLTMINENNGGWKELVVREVSFLRVGWIDTGTCDDMYRYHSFLFQRSDTKDHVYQNQKERAGF